ncbi:MAG: hypothetical protein ACXVZX_02815 [Terriglobales bacterium]
MNRFRILNSRKRALIALVHSAAFGLLAGYQLMINHHPAPLVGAIAGHVTGPAILTSIYFIVTTVLLLLVIASRGPIEKLYFAFCSTSAAVGLFRVVLGDPTVYAGNLLRVFMLGCAVLTGTLILRLHQEPQPQFAE